MDLFSDLRASARAARMPLADRMRPRSLSEVVGQEHILGKGRLLRRLLESDRIGSLILFGPPGTGKTTLALLIAGHSQAEFVTLHAADASVKDVRAVIEQAESRLLAGKRTVLFLDEIHRFTRSQQDSLLRDVESGLITLIGATTENPYRVVTGPLLSRSRVFELHALTSDDVYKLLRRAADDRERGLGMLGVTIEDEALRVLAERSDGDARRALSALEVAALSRANSGPRPPIGPQPPNGPQPSIGPQPPSAAFEERIANSEERSGPAPAGAPSGAETSNPDSPVQRPEEQEYLALRSSNFAPPLVSAADALEALQRRIPAYDRAGDAHYDITSAFIKSMRGSDPDAALYWLARMIEGGEDPRFIARRIAIAASEDVGLADPQALLIAAAAAQITELVGLPEARYALAHATIYVTLAPKSHTVTRAISAALEDAASGDPLPVPAPLRDGSWGGEKLGRGQGYQNPHNTEAGFIEQDYLPAPRRYFYPQGKWAETGLKERYEGLWGERGGEQ